MKQLKPYGFDAGGSKRRFATVEQAETAARSVCAKTGEYIVVERLHPNNGRAELLFYVCRDAFDRVWTDLCPAGAELL